MDSVSNRENSDVNWIIQFANLIIAITFIQWLSILSGYLNNCEWVGWLLTFIFSLTYIIAIILFEKINSIKEVYTSDFWNTQVLYNLCGIFGVIVLFLFIPTSLFSNNLTNSFMPNVIITLILWMIFIFLVIPSLEWAYKKERSI